MSRIFYDEFFRTSSTSKFSHVGQKTIIVN